MNLEVLRAKLIEFGLNPRDWKLYPRRQANGNLEVEVLSIDDDDLAFLGRAHGTRWGELVLMDSARSFPKRATYPRSEYA